MCVVVLAVPCYDATGVLGRSCLQQIRPCASHDTCLLPPSFLGQNITGKFDIEYLTALVNAQRAQRAAAAQRGVPENNADQPDDTVTDSQRLKAQATKCREDFRWAKSLKKKRENGSCNFSIRDRALLRP